MNIDKIGVWALRLALCAGMIIGGVMGKDIVCESCGFALLLSFFVLD